MLRAPKPLAWLLIILCELADLRRAGQQLPEQRLAVTAVEFQILPPRFLRRDIALLGASLSQERAILVGCHLFHAVQKLSKLDLSEQVRPSSCCGRIHALVELLEPKPESCSKSLRCSEAACSGIEWHRVNIGFVRSDLARTIAVKKCPDKSGLAAGSRTQCFLNSRRSSIAAQKRRNRTEVIGHG